MTQKRVESSWKTFPSFQPLLNLAQRGTRNFIACSSMDVYFQEAKNNSTVYRMYTVLIHCKVQKLFKWDPEQQTLFPLNLRTVVCFLHFFVKILTPPPFFLQTILSGKHFRVPTTLAVEVESRELHKKYLRYLGHVPQLSASHKVRIGIMRHVPSQVQN